MGEFQRTKKEKSSEYEDVKDRLNEKKERYKALQRDLQQLRSKQQEVIQQSTKNEKIFINELEALETEKKRTTQENFQNLQYQRQEKQRLQSRVANYLEKQKEMQNEKKKFSTWKTMNIESHQALLNEAIAQQNKASAAKMMLEKAIEQE